MTVTVERTYGLGMFPHLPMQPCDVCGHLSYLAAIDGVCLGCTDDKPNEMLSLVASGVYG